MKILFPGSFDPFTIGHENIIKRAINIFKNDITYNEKVEIFIAIAINSNKKGYFPFDKRYEALKKWESNFTKNYPFIFHPYKIHICYYEELTYSYAKSIGANFILRGIRNTIDFEYEKNIADFNKGFGDIETLFLMNDPSITASSTMARELLRNLKEDEAKTLFPVGYNI